MRIIGLFILITIIFFSCSGDKEVITPNFNHNYAGLELGRYVVYDVDSFFYDDFTGTIDTFIFQIREVIESKFIDLEGDDAFTIHRFKKEGTSNWKLMDVWTSKNYHDHL